jgi:hypothetical protein
VPSLESILPWEHKEHLLSMLLMQFGMLSWMHERGFAVASEFK